MGPVLEFEVKISLTLSYVEQRFYDECNSGGIGGGGEVMGYWRDLGQACLIWDKVVFKLKQFRLKI